MDKPKEMGGKMQAYMFLLSMGEKELAERLFKKIVGKIELTEMGNWINQQICGTFPRVDIRCLAFCCSPAKDCPFRNAVLKKLGKTIQDFIGYKSRFGERIKRDLGK